MMIDVLGLLGGIFLWTFLGFAVYSAWRQIKENDDE